jgi:hypothetical protein
MADEPNVLPDGYQGGSYDIVINGFPYTLDTVDHDLPVSEAVATAANGTFKGGLSVKGQQKLSVKINAAVGIPAPAQLVPFPLAIHGYSARNWKATNLKIASANNGAVIRTYSADITEYKAPLVAGIQIP